MLVGIADHIEVLVIVVVYQDRELLAQNIGLGSSHKFYQSHVIDVELQS